MATCVKMYNKSIQLFIQWQESYSQLKHNKDRFDITWMFGRNFHCHFAGGSSTGI